MLQIEIIFDDAVVNNGDSPFAVAVGMSIVFGGIAVGGPARMTDPAGSLHGFNPKDAFEIRQFAGTSPHPDLTGFHDGQSR